MSVWGKNRAISLDPRTENHFKITLFEQLDPFFLLVTQNAPPPRGLLSTQRDIICHRDITNLMSR